MSGTYFTYFSEDKIREIAMNLIARAAAGVEAYSIHEMLCDYIPEQDYDNSQVYYQLWNHDVLAVQRALRSANITIDYNS